ncbi:MAG TPA: hypothetical protein PKM20_02510, partial [Nitrosomonas sp.]|nr:hypothetical protein [Nitrosomonas sp.]
SIYYFRLFTSNPVRTGLIMSQDVSIKRRSFIYLENGKNEKMTVLKLLDQSFKQVNFLLKPDMAYNTCYHSLIEV